uniref:Pentraxin (PTX) domain-containing protein n=1 Tax=Laticauda laticaudata TaxID=8630 RepID=A0A8C5RVI5_LATLA
MIAMHWTLLCLIFSPLLIASEHGLPKFICSPMPLDIDNGCQSNGHQRHGGAANGAGNGHRVGTLEEAKETILHLRETVVHQKEMILDQRETVRELTAKLSRCETHSRRHSEHHGNHQEENHNHKHGHHEGGHRGHHDNGQRGYHEDAHQSHHEDGHRGHRDADLQDLHEGHAQENEHHQTVQSGNHEPQVGHNTHDSSHKGSTSAQVNAMEDPPNEASAAIHQMERMLKSLKERLEYLQHNWNNSTFSTSMWDTLQEKITLLEHQIHEKSNTSEHQTHSVPKSKGMRQRHVSHGRMMETKPDLLGNKEDKHSERFHVDFPLRTNYMYIKIKHTLQREIFAFSICLWLKSTSSPGIGTPFSYSVPNQANEVVLIQWGNNPMELLINDKVATLSLAVNDAKWHHICVTWSTQHGIWKSYQDGVQRGSGENLAPWHPVKPGGVFILGQEQVNRHLNFVCCHYCAWLF